mgnify:CR=1 FL=1
MRIFLAFLFLCFTQMHLLSYDIFMIKRNCNLLKLKSSYLFHEINLRKQKFLQQNPNASLISLGIGDTSQPLPQTILKGLTEGSNKLGTFEGYTGYGPEQGGMPLRKKISEVIYQGNLSPEDIFISDGAGCDIGRLQVLFGGQRSIAVQDPTYPAYVDGSIIQGVEEIVFMPCTPENNFFPDLKKLPRTDLIYFCSPNNPTGIASTREQLTELVDFARVNQSILLFDAAYMNFVQSPQYPRSIFEIEGAKEVAIEIGSFSKLAGFTGVRLGWTAISEQLRFSDGSSVKDDWDRVVTTLFNGASSISQHGGLAVLSEAGMEEVRQLTRFYLENAGILKSFLHKKGFKIHGGEHSPYLWTQFNGRKSWELFQEILEQAHVLTVPGVGFGPSGEGFIRFSAFGKREKILEAIERLQKLDDGGLSRHR